MPSAREKLTLFGMSLSPMPHMQAAEDAIKIFYASLSQGRQVVKRTDLKELGKQAKTHWSEQENENLVIKIGNEAQIPFSNFREFVITLALTAFRRLDPSGDESLDETQLGPVTRSFETISPEKILRTAYKILPSGAAKGGSPEQRWFGWRVSITEFPAFVFVACAKSCEDATVTLKGLRNLITASAVKAAPSSQPHAPSVGVSTGEPSLAKQEDQAVVALFRSLDQNALGGIDKREPSMLRLIQSVEAKWSQHEASTVLYTWRQAKGTVSLPGFKSMVHKILDMVFDHLRGGGALTLAEEQLVQVGAAFGKSPDQHMEALRYIASKKRAGHHLHRIELQDFKAYVLVECVRKCGGPDAVSGLEKMVLLNIQHIQGQHIDVLQELQKAIARDHSTVLTLFRNFDADGSGFIEPNEFKAALKPLGIESDQVEAFLKEIDTDRDGRIAYDELLQSLRQVSHTQLRAPPISGSANSSRKQPCSVGEVEKELFTRLHAYMEQRQSTVLSTFKALDKDGSGYIDQKELTDGLQRIGVPLSPSEIRMVLKCIDGNGDKRIEYKELLQTMKRLTRDNTKATAASKKAVNQSHLARSKQGKQEGLSDKAPRPPPVQVPSGGPAPQPPAAGPTQPPSTQGMDLYQQQQAPQEEVNDYDRQVELLQRQIAELEASTAAQAAKGGPIDRAFAPLPGPGWDVLPSDMHGGQGSMGVRDSQESDAALLSEFNTMCSALEAQITAKEEEIMAAEAQLTRQEVTQTQPPPPTSAPVAITPAPAPVANVPATVQPPAASAPPLPPQPATIQPVVQVFFNGMSCGGGIQQGGFPQGQNQQWMPQGKSQGWNGQMPPMDISAAEALSQGPWNDDFRLGKPKPKWEGTVPLSTANNLTDAHREVLGRLHAHISKQHSTVIATFRQLDKDGSGYIESNEFGRALAKIGMQLSPSEVKMILSTIDANRDGKIEYKELMESLQRVMKGERNGQIGTAWGNTKRGGVRGRRSSNKEIEEMKSAVLNLSRQLKDLKSGMKDILDAKDGRGGGIGGGPFARMSHVPGSSNSRLVSRKMAEAKERKKEREIRHLGVALAQFREQFSLLKSTRHIPAHQQDAMSNLYGQLASKAQQLVDRIDHNLTEDSQGRYGAGLGGEKSWSELLGLDRLSLQDLKDSFQRASSMNRFRSKLSRADFDSFLEELTGLRYSAATKSMSEGLFAVLDSDSNGSLDWKEVYSGLALLTRGTPDEKLKVAFHMFDVDGNGYIDERELRRLLRRTGGSSDPYRVDQMVQQILQGSDWTQDRRLNWQEFQRSAMAHGIMEWIEATRQEVEAHVNAARRGLPGPTRYPTQVGQSAYPQGGPSESWSELLGLDRLSLQDLKDSFQRASSMNRFRSKLSRADFDSFLEELTGLRYSAATKSMSEGLFAVLDSDSNGSLDWKEVYSGLALLTRGTPDEKLKVAFHMFDVDGNGYIDERELRRLLRRTGGSSDPYRVDQMVQQILQGSDWTQDRRLNWQEFQRSAMAHGIMEWIEATRQEVEAHVNAARRGLPGPTRYPTQVGQPYQQQELAYQQPPLAYQQHQPYTSAPTGVLGLQQQQPYQQQLYPHQQQPFGPGNQQLSLSLTTPHERVPSYGPVYNEHQPYQNQLDLRMSTNSRDLLGKLDVAPQNALGFQLQQQPYSPAQPYQQYPYQQQQAYNPTNTGISGLQQQQPQQWPGMAVQPMQLQMQPFPQLAQQPQQPAPPSPFGTPSRAQTANSWFTQPAQVSQQQQWQGAQSVPLPPQQWPGAQPPAPAVQYAQPGGPQPA